MNTTIKLPAGHELICISGKGSHSIWRAVHTAGCGLRSSGDHRGYRVGQQKCKAQANEHTCPAAEVAEIPAPLDIPAAVREYIEAEWRGAALVMSAKRGEVIAALLAADPELGNAKASLRFALMVAEARDNDNLPLNVLPAAEGLALLQAISDSDQVRIGDLKLIDAKCRPVRYGVAYTGNATFTILRAVNPIPGTPPTLVVQFRGSAGTVERFAHSLFDGWRWI